MDYQRYDETPLELVIQYRHDVCSDKQKAKTVMVESAWAVLLQCGDSWQKAASDLGPADFLLLQGSHAPALRATQTCTGESLWQVLQRCPLPPSQLLERLGCDHLIRVSEDR